MSYPAKIKQLMEEVRFAKEKQLDLKMKLNDEKNGLLVNVPAEEERGPGAQNHTAHELDRAETI